MDLLLVDARRCQVIVAVAHESGFGKDIRDGRVESGKEVVMIPGTLCMVSGEVRLVLPVAAAGKPGKGIEDGPCDRPSAIFFDLLVVGTVGGRGDAARSGIDGSWRRVGRWRQIKSGFALDRRQR